MLYGRENIEAKCASTIKENPKEVLKRLTYSKKCVEEEIKKKKQIRKHLFGMLRSGAFYKEEHLIVLIGEISFKLENMKRDLKEKRKRILQLRSRK